MTVAKTRPSTSGKAAFIATSAGARPAFLVSQISRLLNEIGTCKTGHPSCSKNERRSEPPDEMEKLWVRRMTSGGFSSATAAAPSVPLGYGARKNRMNRPAAPCFRAPHVRHRLPLSRQFETMPDRNRSKLASSEVLG